MNLSMIISCPLILVCYQVIRLISAGNSPEADRQSVPGIDCDHCQVRSTNSFSLN